MGVVETHLEQDEPFEIEGYESVRNDRNMYGGGIMILYKEQLKNVLTVIREVKSEYEALWIRIDNGKIAMKIGVVYMPQENKTNLNKMKEIYKNLEVEIKESVEKKEELIVMGDFNCKIGINEKEEPEKGISKGGKQLMKLVKRYELIITNKTEKCQGMWTRKQGNERSVLDYILIRQEHERYMESMTIDENKIKTPYWRNEEEQRNIYTDHCMIRMDMNWRLKLEDEQPKLVMGRKEREHFLQELEEEKISEIIDEKNLQESYTKWNKKVIEIARRNMRKPKKMKDWKEARLLRKADKSVKNQLKKTHNRKERKILKERRRLIEQHLNNMLRKKKTTKVNKIVEEMKKGGGVDSEVFWTVRNKILGRSKEGKYAVEDENGELQKTPEEIKEVYRTHFDNLLNRKNAKEADEDTKKMVDTMIKGIECLNLTSQKPEITDKDLEEAISSMKKKKFDRSEWCSTWIKLGGNEMKQSLIKIFNHLNKNQTNLEEWEKMTIKAISKKKPYSKMKNKRGLFLTNIVSKLYEKTIKNRNEQNLNKGISENQNGGKSGRAPIDVVMLLLAIIERNIYLGNDTYLTFTDIEKCFDNLWLDDCIVDVWKNGMQTSDAVMTRRMNDKSKVKVETPFGVTNEIQLKSVVKQGGVAGVTLCCSSIDSINKGGRKIVTMYGPELEINAQAYVDDISSAGSATTANNTIYNCSLMEERKRVSVNTDQGKSAVMIVKGKKKNKDREITEEVSRGEIQKCNEYKALGTWINSKGNYETNIENINNKLQGMISSTKRMGASEEVGIMAVQARLKLYETTMLPSILYNVEAYAKLAEKEIKELERIQHSVLVQLLELPIVHNVYRYTDGTGYVDDGSKNTL